jgi:hypothetical protein
MLHLWHGNILHDHPNNLILKLLVGFISHLGSRDGALREHLGIMQVILTLCQYRPLVEESRITPEG